MRTVRRRAAAALVAASLAASACACGEKDPPVEETAAGKAAAAATAAPAPMKPLGSAIPADTEVKSLPSGLKYSVLKAGTGAKPRRGDVVRVHYTGWLTDGKEFDSSRRGKEPAEFQLGKVVEGWNQALCEMQVGARWKLTIPPELGYGAAGSPPVIPPDATLVFDVELLGVRAAPEFRPVDAAAAKTTESGLVCQILEPGTGKAPGESDAVELDFAVWQADGLLLHASSLAGQPIQGTKADMRMPFLKEAPFLLKEGGTMLVEVPQAMARKPGATQAPPGEKSIWRLTLKRVGKPRPAPEFVLPPADKLVAGAGGLKHQVLVEGTGPSPGPGDDVVVEYAGWLADGTLFDCSHQRGLPTTFRLGPGRLIDGWNVGMQAMKAGGTSILVIPPELGYGARGQGAKIPPNATLVFRIELLEVRK